MVVSTHTLYLIIADNPKMPTKAELRRAQRKKRYVDNHEVTMKKCYAKNADKHKAVKHEYSVIYSILREKELLKTL